ncbi:MAG TPA: nuclear transport factor 2 family protein [Solirubrobacteraceae bacterium]|nr:nuclear transport factor 2 family protein [Solirubrobacteraceae bacterium]
MITKHQQMPADAATVDDVDAINEAVQRFIDGTARGDAATLAAACHPDARMYGAIGGQRFDVPVTEFAKVVAESPADAAGTYRARITSIVHEGDAASATVVEDGFWGTMSFVDFLGLCHTEGGWRIVSKTFAHTGGEPPSHA